MIKNGGLSIFKSKCRIGRQSMTAIQTNGNVDLETKTQAFFGRFGFRPDQLFQLLVEKGSQFIDIDGRW